MDGVSNAYILDVVDIYVDTEPNSTDYIIGETFDKNGMVVKAKYQNGEEREITGYTIYPEVITENINNITISYTEGNSTKTTTQNINLYNLKEHIDNDIYLYYDNSSKVMLLKGNGIFTNNIENQDVEKIVIDEGIDSILLDSINNMSKLNAIYVLDRECTISNASRINDNITIYCYKDSNIQEYCKTNNIPYIEYDDFYKCGKNAYAFLDRTDKKLTISGIGDLYEFNLSKLPWIEANQYINTVEIENGISIISKKLFAENTNIQAVKLGNDVTKIDGFAFYNCTNLIQIELNDNLQSIGICAFYNCTNLKEIEIPDKVNKIEGYCFYNCTNLEHVNLSENIYKIPRYTFYNCVSLKEIKIPYNINDLESQAFMNCANLKKVDFSNSNLRGIGTATFYGCTSLEEIIMPDSIKNIYEDAFENCTSLKTLEFSHGLTNLRDKVAQNCRSLEEIVIPYGMKTIGDNNFSRGTNLKKVILPCSLVEIGNSNFSQCNNLQYLIIPDSIIINEEIDLITPMTNLTIYCKSNTSIQEYAVNKEINYVTDDIKPNLNVTQEKLDNGSRRITIIASDDNEIVGLSDYPYSFDGGKTWQPEPYKDFGTNSTITVCARDAVGNIAEQYVTIQEATRILTGIEIRTKPQKINTYKVGETLDTNGLTLTAMYNNGETEEITEGFTCTPTQLNTPGFQKITVSYGGQTTTFNVRVQDYITGITLRVPTKATYKHGENINLAEGIITIKKASGSTETIGMQNSNVSITEADGNELNMSPLNYDNTNKVEKILKISYTQDKVTGNINYPITIINDVKSIEIKGEPKKEYNMNDTLNLSTGTILVKRAVGEEEISLTDSRVTVTGFNSSAENTSLQLTVTFEENGIRSQTTYNVSIKKPEKENLEINIREYIVEEVGKVKYINNINPGVTVGQVLGKIETNAGATKKAYKGTTEITDISKELATGMTIKISLNGQEVEYIVVISGDINEDGKITATDLTRMKNHILEKTTLENLGLKAADLNNDGRITATELTKIKKYILGMSIQLH